MDLYLSKNTLCNLVSYSLSHSLYGALKYPENRLNGAINFLAFRILYSASFGLTNYLLPTETEDLTFQRRSDVPLKTAQNLLRTANVTLKIAATLFLTRYYSRLVRLCFNSSSAKPFSVSPRDHLGVSVLNYIIKKVVQMD